MTAISFLLFFFESFF